MRSVLVLKPSSLGDVVHTLPAVARWKAAAPEIRVTWLINPEWAPLLVGNPDVAEVLPFPRREFTAASGWAWLRREILGRRPDLALDFQGLLRTALLGRISGARRLHGLGDAREGATWFYHRTVPVPPTVAGRPPHAVERYLALVDDLIGGAPLVKADLRFPLPAGTPLPEDAPPAGSIVLHPFSRGAGKSLNAAQVTRFCEALAPRPVAIVGKAPPGLIATLGGRSWPANAFDLLGRTDLLQLVALLRQAAFTISVDSGPMHLAAALSDRVVGLHSWSDPRQVGPYRAAAHVWKAGRLWRVADLAAAPGEAMKRPASLESELNPEAIRMICEFALRSLQAD